MSTRTKNNVCNHSDDHRNISYQYLSNVLKQRGYKSNLLHFLVDLEHLQRLHNLAANLTLDWSDITQNKQGQLAYSF